MKKLFDKNQYIQLDEATHTYRNMIGKKYQSITTRLNEFKEFDEEKIAKLTARGQLGKSASDAHVEILCKSIKEEWKVTRENASKYGTGMHKFLEIGNCEEIEFMNKINPNVTYERLQNLAIGISNFLNEYAEQYNEEILWDDETGKAGCVDKTCLRTIRSNVIDIFDYKTNITKGIYFDSIKRDNGKWKKHYNRYYKEPFENVEQSNYFDYCGQLSTYGRMAEKLGYRVGRLAIIYIDLELNFVVIPVPYMRHEADVILGARIEVNLNKNLTNVSVQNSEEEDW